MAASVTTPLGVVVPGTGTVKAAATKVANAVVPGLSAITSTAQGAETFFSDVLSANFWYRALKVVAGAILLFIGVSHLTGFDNAVTRVASQAGSAVMKTAV